MGAAERELAYAALEQIVQAQEAVHRIIAHAHANESMYGALETADLCQRAHAQLVGAYDILFAAFNVTGSPVPKEGGNGEHAP